MTYVKQTWQDGTPQYPVSAVRMGVIEQGIYDAHYTPAVQLRNDAAISFANGQTIVAWAQEDFKTVSSMHSTAASTTRMIAPVAGVYLTTASLDWAVNSTGQRALGFNKNSINPGTQSVNFKWLTILPPVAALDTVVMGAMLWNLVVNDYIEVVAYQSSGGALNLNTGSHASMSLISYV